MTSRSRIVAGVILGAALVLAGGCKTAPKPEPVLTTPPPSVDVFEQIKSQFASNADARVGKISETLPGESLARIEGVDAADFPANGAVLILDGAGSQIATAVVDRIDNSTVVVKYATGTRAPEVGDVAVRFVR
jgi:hypothetical protein